LKIISAFVFLYKLIYFVDLSIIQLEGVLNTDVLLFRERHAGNSNPSGECLFWNSDLGGNVQSMLRQQFRRKRYT